MLKFIRPEGLIAASEGSTSDSDSGHEYRFEAAQAVPTPGAASLQARADLFNIFNQPNFGPPTNYMSSPLFGQSTQMLGASLGSGGQNGGLNPLYQIGGLRSAQLALKLVF